MAKFKFRLATLLRLRESAREERQEQLAEAYRVDDVLREQVAEVEQELDVMRADCRRAAGPGDINVDQLIAAQRYELLLKAQQANLEKQRETVATEIERRRLALVEANRDVRVLEKLRDNQRRQHRENENHREVKQLDEVAGQQRVRQETIR